MPLVISQEHYLDIIWIVGKAVISSYIRTERNNKTYLTMYNIHLYALIIMANISEIGNWGSEYELSTYSVEMDIYIYSLLWA